MTAQDGGTIVEDKRGRQYVQFPDGKKYDCTGYIGETRIGYMCATDFEHELGEHCCKRDGTPEGTRIFDSVEELPERSKECGSVKVILVVIESRRGNRREGE